MRGIKVHGKPHIRGKTAGGRGRSNAASSRSSGY